MTEPNRRGFLIGAGATVAGAAALAAVTRSGAAETDEVALSGGHHGDIVAHVHDVRAGTISLMVEGHQVTLTDRALASRIAAAMRTPV